MRLYHIQRSEKYDNRYNDWKNSFHIYIPNPDKPEIRNSPDLIKLAEIRNKFKSPKFK
jgi:hypothetical protein